MWSIVNASAAALRGGGAAFSPSAGGLRKLYPAMVDDAWLSPGWYQSQTLSTDSFQLQGIVYFCTPGTAFKFPLSASRLRPNRPTSPRYSSSSGAAPSIVAKMKPL